MPLEQHDIDYTFTKSERLCSKKAIDDLFSAGKSNTQFPIKVIYKLSEFESTFPVRVLFVVPKKKHKRANKRNVLKRRMREAYRLKKHVLYKALEFQKIDMMFVYLSNQAVNYAEIDKCISLLLNSVVNKIGSMAMK